MFVRSRPSRTRTRTRTTISLSWARSASTTTSTARRSAGRASIEDEVDFADVFEGVVLKVEELLRTEVEGLLTVGGASGADDIGTGLACELGHHRPDCAGRAVGEEPLPGPKAAVLEQSLPGGQT
jgi:hypothetical protein